MKVVDLTGIMPENIQDAMEVSREKGYDLILLGSVNEYYYGGLSSASKVSISVRVIDVRTESTLGDIVGIMKDRYEERFDYIFYKRESREATSPSLLAAKVMEKILNEITGTPEIPEK
jgi:TolB-like protein